MADRRADVLGFRVVYDIPAVKTTAVKE